MRLDAEEALLAGLLLTGAYLLSKKEDEPVAVPLDRLLGRDVQRLMGV